MSDRKSLDVVSFESNENCTALPSVNEKTVVSAPTQATTTKHNELSGMQGGTVTQRYHLDLDQINGLNELLATPDYSLPIASVSTLGGVKQGSGVTIAIDGTITVDNAGDLSLVHTTGDETIAGQKLFTGDFKVSTSDITNASKYTNIVTKSNIATPISYMEASMDYSGVNEYSYMNVKPKGAYMGTNTGYIGVYNKTAQIIDQEIQFKSNRILIQGYSSPTDDAKYSGYLKAVNDGTGKYILQGGGDPIINQTSTPQAAGFNVSGNGTIGGNAWVNLDLIMKPNQLIQLADGRSAIIGTYNGVEYRLANNDATDYPDYSKSFKFRNKGFNYLTMGSNSVDGGGSSALLFNWATLEARLTMTDVPTSASSYDLMVRNTATGLLEKVPSATFAANSITNQTATPQTAGFNVTLKSKIDNISISRGVGTNVVSSLGVGRDPLFSNTAGVSNTAIGSFVLYANTTGNYNTAGGGVALSNNTTGSSNTAWGQWALYYNTIGGGNVAIGLAAGTGTGEGAWATNEKSQVDNYATFIGYNTSRDGSIPQATVLNNITAIGSFAKVGSSNSLILGGLGANAVRVGIGTAIPNASAVLDIVSTTKGVLMPRVTTAQRDAIPTPAEGLELYNTTTKAKEIYNGTNWATIGGTTGAILSGVPVYTFASLRAVATTDLAGTVYVSDTGRDGFFTVVPGDTTTTDDNGVMIVTAGGQRLKRVFTGYVNLAWFGLVNDPTAESASTDQRNIIAQPLFENRYGRYYIPEGNYWVSTYDGNSTGLTSATFVLQSNCEVLMHPSCKIRIRTNITSQGIMWHLPYGTENTTLDGGEMFGDRYFNTDIGEYGFLIKPQNTKNCTIKNMKLRDAHGDGIYVAGLTSVFTNVYAPATQTLTGVATYIWYNVLVKGTGSVEFKNTSTNEVYATVNQANNNIRIKFPVSTITATVIGTLTEVRVDCVNENLQIVNVEASNCRRQGISVISALDIKIDKCWFHHINGTAPAAGIDFEPNGAEYRCTGVINNTVCEFNEGDGIQVSGQDVQINNCRTDNNGGNGLRLANVNTCSRDHIVNGLISQNNVGEGIKTSGGKRLTVNNVMIRNMGGMGMTLSGYDSVTANNVQIEGTAGNGLNVIGNLEANLSNIYINDYAKVTSASQGIYLRHDNIRLSNFRVKGGSMASTLGVNGINAEAGRKNIIISNGQVEGSPRTGILMASSDSMLLDVIAQDNAVQSGSTYHNISVTGSNNMIARVVARRTINTARYGLNIDATATGTRVFDNNITAHQTGVIQDNGVGTIYSTTLIGRTAVADVAYTQTVDDERISITSLTAPRTITLLAAAAWKGRKIVIKDESGLAAISNITIAGTIEGTVNRVINTNYGKIELYSNGTSIFIA